MAFTPATPGWVAIDVTPIASTGETISFGLDAATGNELAQFSSKEGAPPPRLKVKLAADA